MKFRLVICPPVSTLKNVFRYSFSINKKKNATKRTKPLPNTSVNFLKANTVPPLNACSNKSNPKNDITVKPTKGEQRFSV